MDLFERIKQISVKKNVSIRTIEKLSGLSNGVIQNWATSSPRMDLLLKVADYLEVTLDELVGRSPPSPVSSKFFKEFNASPKTVQDMTWNYMRDLNKLMTQDKQEKKEVN